MGLEYYAFALFIAGLVCIVAIICRVLFSNVKKQNRMLDEREKEVLHLYNSVETIMEEFQDQAKATIDELKLREQEYRAALQNIAAFQLPPEVEKKGQAIEKVPRSVPFDANRIRAAGEVIERAERLYATEARAAVPGETPTAVKTPILFTDAANTPVKTPAVPANAATPSIYGDEKSEVKPAVFQKFFDDSAQMPTPTPYSPAAITGSRSEAIRALANEGKTDVEIASQLGITRNEVQIVIDLTR